MKEYIYPFLASLFITHILAVYGLLLHGNLNIFFFQQTLGDTAAIVLGLTLLIGPMSRSYAWFSRFLKYRKEIGVMVFLFALLHAALSYLEVFRIFSAGFWVRYLTIPNLAGTSGLTGLFLLFISSRKFIQARLGNKLWWQIQYKGVRITALLVFAHIVLVSGEASRNWLMGSTSGKFPPVALIITHFGLWVFGVRLLEWILPKQAKYAILPTLIINIIFLLAIFARSQYYFRV